jgi:RimJ/RimL family protein N-acetyltransferase
MFESPILSGEAVKLCTPLEGDLPVVAVWFQDEAFLRQASGAAAVPRTEENVRRWYLTNDAHTMTFGVRGLADDALVGYVQLQVSSWPHRNAEVDLGVAPKRWGQGIGTDALKLALAFAFRELNLHRVQVSPFSYNERGLALCKKLGFTHEGTLREYLRRDGKWYNLLVMALLARDWRGGQ